MKIKLQEYIRIEEEHNTKAVYTLSVYEQSFNWQIHRTGSRNRPIPLKGVKTV